MIAEEDVFVLGLRRSGIHAAVNWLIPHYAGLARFINDHEFAPAGSARSPLAGNPTQFYFTEEQATWRVFGQNSHGLLEQALPELPDRFPGWARPLVRSGMRKFFRWQARRPRPSSPSPRADQTLRPAAVNIFTVENMLPREFARAHERWRRETCAPHLAQLGFRPAPRTTVLLVLREPWNTLASLLKHPQPNPPRPIAPGALLPHWLEIAQEFAGETNEVASVGRTVCFNYAAWFRDARYRRQIAQALGRPFTDRGLEVVTAFGGGSSFDGLAQAGRAQTMTVGERWREFARHPLMAALLENAEVGRLCARIFGRAAPGATA